MALLMAAGLMACGGTTVEKDTSEQAVNQSEEAASGESSSEQSSSAGQTDIVVMIESPDEAFTATVLDMVREHFPQYNIISKPWSDAGDTNQTVKSTFATSSEALDIVMYPNLPKILYTGGC